MKKTLAILIVLLTAAMFLTGCMQQLPEGYNQKSVDARCAEIVGLINNLDYEGIDDLASSYYGETKTVPAVHVDEMYGIIKTLGALKGIDQVVTDVMKDEAGGYYTISIVIATHQNNWTRYMILLDSGLYLMQVEMV